MQYDFQQLSPHDLETLVRDLFQAEWGALLESFRTGRDGGVDLRLARGPDNLIVQVKHYARTGLPGLLRNLKDEAAKVAKLRPTRYLIATSLPLSPGNKETIAEIFGGALASADVLGQEDLNNLLGRHPKIEQKHYKLWLASRALLDRVLHSDVLTQTEFQVEKIHATIRRNVRNDAYPKALAILERDRVVIISGAPGIGKTTLANMLLYAHLGHNWTPVVIRRDIAEGHKLFQRGLPQIFYFDDFMGATFLGDRSSGLQRNEDRAISDFIEMVRASPNARLVLTTREHIFGQAITFSERLRQIGLSSHKLILHIGSYNLSQKAEILYNHLYFSELPAPYKEALLASDFYLEIVKHPKFNPRLIEWLSSFNRVKSIPPDRYAEFVRNLLRDPSEVWMHAYEQQLSDAGRSLLLTLYSFGGKCDGSALQPAFSKLHAARSARWNFLRRPEDWALAMSELANAFLRPSEKTGFEFIDPSVGDLMNAVLRKAPENAVDLVCGATEFSQAERILEISKRGVPEIIAALTHESAAVAVAIAGLVQRRDRRVTFQGGGGWTEWTDEARLSGVVPLANTMKTPEMLHLSQTLMTALVAALTTRSIRINEGVEALRALQRITWEPLRNLGLERQITDNLLATAQIGCRSDELREIISVLDFDGSEGPAYIEILRDTFEESRSTIATEIKDCRNEDDFSGLREDYELFASILDVNVTTELQELEDAHAEYDAYEEQRADEMSEHFREQYRDQYRDLGSSDANVRDMFASLRNDQFD